MAILVKWVRYSAIILTVAMLAGLIFLAFPMKDRMSQKPNFAALAPTTQVIRSQQAQDGNEDLSPAEQMEHQDSLFLATTKDLVVPHEATKRTQQGPSSLSKLTKGLSSLSKLKGSKQTRATTSNSRNNKLLVSEEEKTGNYSEAEIKMTADNFPAIDDKDSIQHYTQEKLAHNTLATENPDSILTYNIDGQRIKQHDILNASVTVDNIVITLKK